ncbi:MAG: hypothetical protein L0I76_23085 [Pseudonocardia sp.]|nr:hypothetical protein [Pseudonocardia sp.]
MTDDHRSELRLRKLREAQARAHRILRGRILDEDRIKTSRALRLTPPLITGPLLDVLRNPGHTMM